MTHAPIPAILQALREGRMVILMDDEDRENEGDLLIAAQHVTADSINFMAQHGRGLICLTLTEERCRELGLPLMVHNSNNAQNTAFTLSIEAARGVSTGISAQDRAHTIATAVRADAKPDDLVQPGHVFPLMSRRGGVLVRAGHTEAGCDLTHLAGLTPAAVICEILNDNGTMARLPDLMAFSKAHNILIGTIADLIEYRMASEHLVECVLKRQWQTPYGLLEARAYRDQANEVVHMALVLGEPKVERETLVRVQDVASNLEIFALNQLQKRITPTRALQEMSQLGTGVLVLLHRALAPNELLRLMQDEDAAPRWDPRLYGIGAQILRHIGVGKMKLLSSHIKLPSLAGFGLEVCGFVDEPHE